MTQATTLTELRDAFMATQEKYFSDRRALVERLIERKAAERKKYLEDRRALVKKKAAERITQTRAAKELGVTLTCLNNIIRRENIYWPVIRQGQPGATSDLKERAA